MKSEVSTPKSSIEEYVQRFPPDIQEKLQRIREVIRNAAPEAVEAIKYQIPTFVWKGNLVHFAAFKKHIGFYPTPSGIEAFQDELSEYKTSKGAVQFPLDSPVPYSLITKIVKFRMRENHSK